MTNARCAGIPTGVAIGSLVAIDYPLGAQAEASPVCSGLGIDATRNYRFGALVGEFWWVSGIGSSTRSSNEINLNARSGDACCGRSG